MVLARFLPKDEQFFDFFAEAAANAVEVTNALADVVAGGPDTERKVNRLNDLEQRGDEITHRIFNALNSTFVTPLDREDIRALAASLDDMVDDAEEAGERLWLYRLGNGEAPAVLLTRILRDQAAALSRAMPLLANVGRNKDLLRECVLEVHELENEADDALSQALATLYDGATDIPTLIRAMRWGELFGLLEDATDRAEDTADVIEGILLKHG